MESEEKLLCCVCKEECTSAHSCYSCKKPVHVPCAVPGNEDEEGFGSKVLCKSCSSDEPPLKKTKMWLNPYTSDDIRKRKVPKYSEKERKCICITCFEEEREPALYVMSRRDNSTKERHLKRRHVGKTMKDIQILHFECDDEKMRAAKLKYATSLKQADEISKERDNAVGSRKLESKVSISVIDVTLLVVIRFQGDKLNVTLELYKKVALST